MPSNNFDVFISYRRASGSAEARLIRSALANQGLRVFLDVTDLTKGYFDEALLQSIALTPNFIVILSPHALDACAEKEDWLRVEIANAIANRRNIIPVMLPGFKFPAQLPDDIATLLRHQGVEYSHVFFESTISKILEMLGTPTRVKLGEESRIRRVARKLRINPDWLSVVLPFGLATAVAAIVATGYFIHSRSSQAMILQAASSLQTQYRAAIEELPRSGPSAFSEVDKKIGDILKLDPANGYGLYYSGEVKRVKNQTLFTSKSCVIPQALANNNGETLDAYESDFYRYLDIDRTLSNGNAVDDHNIHSCYSVASGHCQERTAWIKHLLANDLYEEARVSVDQDVRAEWLRRALDFADAAKELYQDEKKNPGFIQCTPTTVLIGKINAALVSLPK